MECSWSFVQWTGVVALCLLFLLDASVGIMLRMWLSGPTGDKI